MASLDTWAKRPDLEKEFRGPPVEIPESELLMLEHDLKCSLPSDYREFLQTYSGYILFDSATFPLRNANDKRGSVSFFFGVDELVHHHQNAYESDWPLDLFSGLRLIRSLDEFEILPYEEEESVWVMWPTELLPIADSGGNDTTCLVVAGKQTGFVYYWLHDASPTDPHIYLVAESFDEFMQLLSLNE